MRSPRPYFHTRTAVPRLALVLIVLMLAAGCDSDSAPTPTPISAVPSPTLPVSTPTPFAIPTDTEPVPTVTQPPPAAGAPGAWSRTLSWQGKDTYLLGANYPYYHYGNDFGGNTWGSYGLHDPETNKAVDADFAKMSSLGIRAVRWFVFADGRAGIAYDAAGLPSGIDQFVLPDLDAALEIAKRHNIGLDLVLLDFRFMWDAHTENDVQLGGHASVLASPEGQRALVTNVFEPVFRHAANNPAILSWEVMNEPEWGLQDAGRVDPGITQPLTLATFRAFAKLTVDAIHNIAGTYATIGCANVKWARNWVGLGLDYYQMHYYDWMKPYSSDNLLVMSSESLHLDRPVVVGEFPASNSTIATLPQYLDIWYTHGYAGAWAWSFRGDTTYGTPDPTSLRAWADAHGLATGTPTTP